ncbi:MAG: hypothetical protein FJ271_12895 [Planctomycetes bacterium]|nr:hypothetical protein [Planctomycetota bacterium]
MTTPQLYASSLSIGASSGKSAPGGGGGGGGVTPGTPTTPLGGGAGGGSGGGAGGSASGAWPRMMGWLGEATVALTGVTVWPSGASGSGRPSCTIVGKVAPDADVAEGAWTGVPHGESPRTPAFASSQANPKPRQ